MNNSRKLSKFDFLDSFRGFFAFVVAAGHFQYVTNNIPWKIADHFHTNIGVFGFFVLSSFLLTYRLFIEFKLIIDKGQRNGCSRIKLLFVSTLKFAIRRIARIYPLYISFVFLAIYGPSFVHNLMHCVHTKLPENIWHLVFVIDAGTAITWSVYVETTYYLFIPLICLFASVCGKKWWYIPIIILSAVAIYSDCKWTVQRVRGEVCTICSQFYSWASTFVAGSVAALVYYRLEEHARFLSEKKFMNNQITWQSHRASFQQDSRYSVFESAFSVGLRNILNLLCYVLSITFILFTSGRWQLLPFWDYTNETFYNYPGYHWSLVLVLALVSRGSFVKIFNNKFWNHVGKVSYGLYLSHPIYLENLARTLNPKFFDGFEGFVLYIFISIFSATVTYHLIEYPGMWFGKKLCNLVDKFLS